MQHPIFQIDAFTSELFKGNPAAVCPLKQWPADQVLQNIAAENNLAETAFFIPTDNVIPLRWFTPVCEVDLCGHATLATASVIFDSFPEYCEGKDSLTFSTRSGNLTAKKVSQGLIELDFPQEVISECELMPDVVKGLGLKPQKMFNGSDLVALYNTQAEIENLNPDMRQLKLLAGRGVIVTAPGTEVDFVSRFFGPAVGIDEDPVTGSAHCLTAPYWSKLLGKTVLQARQLSARGGELECEVKGDRVLLRGKAVRYMQGTIFL